MADKNSIDELRAWMRRYSAANPRYGYRRAIKAAVREGWGVSQHKFVALWREEQLQGRPGRPQKRSVESATKILEESRL